MWKYIIGIIILVFIDYPFKIDPYDFKKKRKKRFLKSLVYILLAGLSWFLYEQQIIGKDWQSFFVIAFLTSVLFAIGSFLSAINPNLREIYAMLIFCSILAIGILYWLKDRYFIWFIILEGLLLFAFIANAIDSITDMKRGIDPDVVEADKEKAKKARRGVFKIIKMLIRAYK